MNKKPVVFYHALLWGEWKLLVQSQMLRLHSSGLLNEMEYMTIGVSSFDDESLSWFKDLWLGFPNVIVNRIQKDLLPREERPTLMMLKEWCDAGNGDFPVLYFHTKGLTRTGYNVELWRMYMEHYNIDKWKWAVSMLNNGWDTYGVNLRDDTEELFGKRYPHYSGNFWWAKSSYIRMLDRDMLTGSNRWDGEFWIGSKAKKEKMFNAIESGVDHYDQEYKFNNFIKPSITV